MGACGTGGLALRCVPSTLLPCMLFGLLFPDLCRSPCVHHLTSAALVSRLYPSFLLRSRWFVLLMPVLGVLRWAFFPLRGLVPRFLRSSWRPFARRRSLFSPLFAPSCFRSLCSIRPFVSFFVPSPPLNATPRKNSFYCGPRVASTHSKTKKDRRASSPPPPPPPKQKQNKTAETGKGVFVCWCESSFLFRQRERNVVQRPGGLG